MHNNIMAASSRDHPQMLAPGRYPQWCSRFLRYVDTRPNSEALRKCILSGPYKPTTVLVHVVEATDDSPAVPAQDNDIYSTVDAFQTAQEMWEAMERLQQGESLNIQDVKINLFWEFGKFTSHDGESMESYFTRFYKLMNEMIRNNFTVTTMQRTVNVAAVRENVGSKVVQQSGIQCFNYKEYGHFAKECRKPKRVKDSAYHKEKMLLCKLAEQDVPLQAEQYDWLANTDEEVDEQELEAHYSYMAKIQEVPTTDSGTDSEPVEQNEQYDVESDDERITLANLIANLKLDVDENKKIQKQLKKANTTLAQELKERKTKQAEFEKYKEFNDRTVDYDKLERKLNDALGQLAHKDTVIREGLKSKAYELSVVNEKHDELMKHSLLTKSHYKGLVKKKMKYAKSRPNGKLIYNSILNGPYVRKMIPEPGDANRDITVTETFHLQTDDELSDKELKQIEADDQAIQPILLGLPEDIYAAVDNDKLSDKELKQIEADDQAIQTILLGLPKDIYAAVDSYKTAQEIWLRVQQMMKGSNIGIQEKKAKLFNEWERFTSNEGESIESYYHRFLKLMNDLKRNKHFPEKISTNYTQLYDFLKYNQKEVDELKAKRLAKTQDPLALMANSNNPYVFPAPHQDQSSFNQNYLQQPMPNPEDITDPTTAMNMALALMAKAFKLNYSTPTNNNQRISSNPRNRQIAQPGNPAGYNDVIGNQVIQNAVQNQRVQNVRNQNGLIGVQGNGNQNGNLVAAHAEGNATGQNGNQIKCYNCRGVGHYARNCTVRPKRKDAVFLQTQLLIAQKEEAGIQLQAEEYNLMAATADLDEIKEVNANCILMENLQQASTLGTQTNSALVYDTDGSAEVHENCDDNEIFNMFIQEKQYTELLEPIPESHQVPLNDNDVIFEDTSVEQGGETVEQHPANFEETRALYESLYQNLAIKVEKVNL
nr:hypothetical protein [Tanacetum cinerariifolium]